MTIETSDSIKNIAEALRLFQAETHGVVKDAKNPFHGNRYATLEAVIETARPILTKNGLAFLQAPGNIQEGRIALNTLLLHPASGEWIKATMAIPIVKLSKKKEKNSRELVEPEPPLIDPQSVGSAITYACRYALMAMLGLPPLDDDAEAARPKMEPPTGTAETMASYIRERLAAKPVIAESATDYYVQTSLGRIRQFVKDDDQAGLEEWMREEMDRVWDDLGITPSNEDGRKLINAYKAAMIEFGKRVK